MIEPDIYSRRKHTFPDRGRGRRSALHTVSDDYRGRPVVQTTHLHTALLVPLRGVVGRQMPSGVELAATTAVRNNFSPAGRRDVRLSSV